MGVLLISAGDFFMTVTRSVLVGAALLASTAGGAKASSFQSLYSFTGGADGSLAYGKLAVDKSGNLYGTTVTNGAGNGGTVFQFNQSTGVLTTLYSFTLSGATGSNPQAGVTLVGGNTLYGVTASGGGSANCSFGCGTVFKLNIATQKLTTLYSFSGLADGAAPLGGLAIDKAGVLYGTTTYGGYVPPGGSTGYGTIFRLNPAKKAFTTLHQFGVNNTDDGVDPNAALVLGKSGLLYGTASEAGPHGSGTAFSIDPGTGAFTLLHGFDYHVDGNDPGCNLIFKGTALIGTTHAGGPTSAGDGTVFSLDPSSGTVTTLYSFTGGTDGLFPEGGVVAGPKGLLYGATEQGGSDGAGTAFAVNPKTGKFTLEHDFVTSDGSQPSGALVADKAGVIYGVTSGGGSGHGTIFKITP
jgi:uncharacterized repeat protein (TIGR03803 family)